jgi:DNA-binding transcriptional LysR family regulator
MLQANPGLELDLHEHDNDSAQEALLAGRLDVILFAGRDLRRGITNRHLLELPPYVLTPKGHDLTKKHSVDLRDVAAHPIIQLDRPLARPYLEQLFQSEGLTPKIAARADSTEMVRSLVGAGAGVAVLSMRPMTHHSYGGDELRCVPLSGTLPALQLLAGYAARQPRRLVLAFLEEMERFMASETAVTLTVQ